MINISEKISSLRKTHNLTQEALGEAVGVSAQAVSKWEKGDSLPDISVIPDICKVFSISADILIGNEGNMTSKMYMDKALEVCDGIFAKINLLQETMGKIITPNNCEEYVNDGLSIFTSEADCLLVADGRGFGMYMNNIEYIKNIMSFDLTKSGLIKILSNDKAIKIFSAICSKGRISQNEIIEQIGISQQEVTEQLFILMKHALIQSVADDDDDDSDMVFSIASNGVFLAGVIANAFLFEPDGRKGIKGTSCTHIMTPDKVKIAKA